MKIKILILYAIIVGILSNVSLQGQELPDTVWSKKINVSDLKFSPDGKYIFGSAGIDGVHQLDAQTGNIIRTIKLGNEHLSFSPTGDTVVFSCNHQITLIKTNSGELIDTMIIQNIGLSGCHAQFTIDGRYLAVTTDVYGFDNPQIYFIDIESKQVVKTFSKIFDYSTNISLSPNGKYFSYCGLIKVKNLYYLTIVDLQTFNERQRFEIPKSAAYNLGFTHDSRFVAYYFPNAIHIWDIETNELKKTIKMYSTINTTDPGRGRIVFTYNSKYLIYGYFDWEDFDPNKIIVWNIDGDSLVYEYPYSASTAIDISKDDYIICAGFSYLAPGDHLYLLRPNWKSTDVSEKDTDRFNYLLNHGILKIKFEETIIEKPVINIYNILGNIVVAYCNVSLQTNNEIEMDLNYLNCGVYFVVVDVGGKRRVVKVMMD